MYAIIETGGKQIKVAVEDKVFVEKHGKGEKVIVFKYRAKHNIHKKTGHRQPYTLVSIKAINA